MVGSWVDIAVTKVLRRSTRPTVECSAAEAGPHPHAREGMRSSYAGIDRIKFTGSAPGRLSAGPFGPCTPEQREV